MIVDSLFWRVSGVIVIDLVKLLTSRKTVFSLCCSVVLMFYRLVCSAIRAPFERGGGLLVAVWFLTGSRMSAPVEFKSCKADAWSLLTAIRCAVLSQQEARCTVGHPKNGTL